MTLEEIGFFAIGAVLVSSGLASALVKRTFHSVMFLGVFLVAVAGLYILLGSPLVGVIQILVYVGGILTLFVFAVMFVAGDETDEAAPEPAMRQRSGAWSVLAALAAAAGALYLAARFTWPANRAVYGLVSGWGEALGGTVAWLAALVFLLLAGVAGLLAWLGIRHAIDHWSGARIFGTALAGLLAGLLLAVVATSNAWGTAAPTEASQAAANDLDRVLGSLFGPQAVALEVLGVLLTAVMVGALVLARPLLAVDDEDRYARVTRGQVRESQMASDVGLHAGPPAPQAPPTPAAAPPSTASPASMPPAASAQPPAPVEPGAAPSAPSRAPAPSAPPGGAP